MIDSFVHKGLAELFAKGTTRKIDPQFHKRIVHRLDTLDDAETLADLAAPGYNCHSLKGTKPTRYSIHVNGPWRITFEFEKGHARRVDFEQYY